MPLQKALSYASTALVPLPDELDPYDNPEEVKQWFRKNRDRLRWDEDQGRFVFTSTADDGEDEGDGEK